MSNEVNKFELPDEIVKSTGMAPRDLIIISPPKMGKGTILGALTRQVNGIVFDLEKDGYEYIDARKVSIYKNGNESFLEAYHNYVEYRDLLLTNKGKYDFLIIDTITALDEISEYGGTMYYMYNTVQGQYFNREMDKGRPTGRIYKLGDPEFKTVHDIGEGFGYRWSRQWFLDQIDIFTQISPYRIYAGHIADKIMATKGQTQEVTGIEIALTGKLKRIFASKVTTLSKMISDGSKRLLSFEVDGDNIVAGSRAPHLSGQIVISEKTNDGITTYWDSIYNLNK